MYSYRTLARPPASWLHRDPEVPLLCADSCGEGERPPGGTETLSAGAPGWISLPGCHEQPGCSVFRLWVLCLWVLRGRPERDTLTSTEVGIQVPGASARCTAFRFVMRILCDQGTRPPALSFDIVLLVNRSPFFLSGLS